QALATLLPVLLLALVVVGGIVGGWFTATEGSAVAVLASGILALAWYRELRIADLPALLRDTAATTGMVFLLIGASAATAWILAYSGAPRLIGEALGPMVQQPWMLYLTINLILLAAGMVLDMTPAVLLFTPIFLPLVLATAPAMGLTPAEATLHFGIVMIANLCIGLVTPPVGSVLFISCSIARIGITEIIRPLLPMLVAMLVVLALITYFPQLVLWLPTAVGAR
ncbi:MAG: hypothetical protein RL456_3481, partial [Pseudomonadota bacterium]